MSEPPQQAGDGASPSPASSQPQSPQPQAVRAGLASLPVPEATEQFWSRLEGELEEESPLQIAPRPAIRPINQPPPTAAAQSPVDDVFERGGNRRSVVGRRAGGLSSAVGESLGGGSSSRKRLVVLAVIAAIIALAALGGLFKDDESDPERTVETGDPEGEGADADGDVAAGAETTEQPETTTTETTVPQARGLEPEVPLHAGGVGLLETGVMTLQDVTAVAAVEPEVNENAFVASGGNCYDAVLPGAADLTLWFRSADGEGLEDPAAGVLSAISLRGRTDRGTVEGFVLGTHELELHAYYEWRLQTYNNPYHPQGAIYIAPDDESDNAVGFVTGNEQILEIRVGHQPLITQADLCQL